MNEVIDRNAQRAHGEGEPLWSLIVLTALVAFSAAAFTFDPTRSYWLDESITAWIISGGWSEVIQRSALYQGQSPLYYGVVKLFADLCGHTEFMLRLPSMGASIGSLLLTALIGQRLGGRWIATTAPLLLLLHDGFIRAGFFARPYALALLCTLCSIYCFQQFVIRRKNISLILAAITLLTAFYLHYLFCAAALVHLMLALRVRWSRAEVLQLGLVVLISIVILLPGFRHLYALSQRSELFELGWAPSIGGLLRYLLPPALLMGGLLAYLCGISFVRRDRLTMLSREGIKEKLILCVIWGFLPPSIFVLLSIVLKSNLYLDRYYLWSGVGVSFSVAFLVNYLSSHSQRWIVNAILILFLFAIPRRWHGENWREAAEKIPEDAVVLLYSGLIEGGSVPFLAASENQDYFKLPLLIYRPRLKIIPIPPHLGLDGAHAYFDQVVVPLLRTQQGFFLLTPRVVQFGLQTQQSVAEYYISLLAAAGYKLAGERVPQVNPEVLHFSAP